MEYTPAFVLIFPLVLVSVYRRKWAFWVVCMSTPFYGLQLFQAVGHWFNFPEVAVLGLGCAQLVRWARTREFTVPTTPTTYWLVAFLGVAVLSGIYAVVRPPDVLVHLYSAGGHKPMTLVEWSFSTAYVTQFAYRAFAVGAIVLCVLSLTETRIRRATRALVYGAVFTGLFGVVLQIAQEFGYKTLPRTLVELGFHIQIDLLRMDPIPRMWSFPGEPGFVAHYLLFALAIVTVVFLSDSESGLFDRRAAGGLTALLAVLLLLSTGTTGYGGVVILGVALLFGSAVLPTLSRRRTGALAVGAALGFVGIIWIAANTLQAEIFEWLLRQSEKLQFTANSGSVRIQYLEHALTIAAHRPLLGVGVGGYYGTTLLGTLLAETGILGLSAFLGAIATVCYRLWRRAASRDVLASVYLVTVLTIVPTSLLAKSVTVLRFPWFWFALALPIAYLWRSDADGRA